MKMEFDYRLPKELAMTNIEEITEELKEIVNTHDRDVFVINGENVENVDASGIQLLLAVYKSITNNNKEFRLDNPSSALKYTMSLSGADKIL